ncbi:MAG TPA: acyl-CoA desaturase [Candidatus Dormibacteraeota bacterium]|nr:acyl-CoA desaturase [Candidatus Dormibacteraeota bacterium]
MLSVVPPNLRTEVTPNDLATSPERGATSPASDYAVLKRRIRAAGLLDKQPWYYALCISANVAMLGLCLLLLVVLHNPWLIALAAIGLGLVSGQLGFQLHDAGHKQMFERNSLNDLVGYATGNLLLGMSYGWWVDKHNRHHANPNHVDFDPDINNLAIAYNQEQALERRGPLRWLAAYQAFAFFPMLFLLGVSMHVSGISFLRSGKAKRPLVEVVLLIVHAVVYIGVLAFLLGPWLALLVIVIHKATGGFYMASVFAPNHKGMPQMDGSVQLDFLRTQVLTARNVRSGAATDLWYGSLNYQIEHHLFPAMPRNRVRAAHQIVRAFCGEVSVPYYETSMVQSYRELLSYLHEVGRPLRAAGA